MRNLVSVLKRFPVGSQSHKGTELGLLTLCASVAL